MRQTDVLNPQTAPGRIPLRRISNYRLLIFAGKGSDDEGRGGPLAAITWALTKTDGALVFSKSGRRDRASHVRLESEYKQKAV
jgi:hypothetical protein